MRTSEKLRQMREIEARNDASIAAHQSKAQRRADALARLRESVDTMITPATAAEVIGCNPQYIRVAARNNPDALGFPVIISGNRTHIPRAEFIRYVDGGV